ncbi:MAG: hypothetical protein QF600_02515 [Verrucomicrobiota bacterium]|jgi:hypothetical protein|nr:hypothetical protein [Verrucomicrobiota bacterium]
MHTIRFIIILAVALGQAAVALAEFRAGIAVRLVTPDPLLPVSGGVGPSNPVTQKRGDLTVRALVLESGGIRVAFVSTDFLGFPAVLGDRVRQQVRSIPAKNILIGATHTHSAPDCYGFPNGRGGTDTDLDYLDFVCNAAAKAINEAVDGLQPATLRTATGKANGKIAYNYYAPQLYDPRCSVMQAVGRDGNPFATLVNYAIHPEVLGSSQGILSPDMVGPLYDRIAVSGGGTGIFMNGAQGGMVTADVRGPDGKDVQTWQECRRIGHRLADEALRIVSSAAAQSNPEILCTGREVTLPVDSPLLLAIMKSSPLKLAKQDKKSITTHINLVQVGDAQILTIPGEALPNIGYYLKRKMTGRHNLLFGLTNDALGYFLTKEDWNSFDRYDYITRTCLGEKTGEILIHESLRLINEAAAE